jgi:hypothetical protein
VPTIGHTSQIHQPEIRSREAKKKKKNEGKKEGVASLGICHDRFRPTAASASSVKWHFMEAERIASGEKTLRPERPWQKKTGQCLSGLPEYTIFF